MKKWNRMMIIAVSGVALAFAACDSDGDDGGSTTDTSSLQDTSGGDTTSADDTTATDTLVTAPSDQCTGTDDLARISDTNQTSPSDIAAACGTQVCIAQALAGDFEGAKTCADDCMLNGNADNNITAAGLSDDCSSCYVNAVLCGAQHCLAKCAADASAQPCVDCRAGNNDAGVDCTGDFYTCSGLSQN